MFREIDITEGATQPGIDTFEAFGCCEPQTVRYVNACVGITMRRESEWKGSCKGHGCKCKGSRVGEQEAAMTAPDMTCQAIVPQPRGAFLSLKSGNYVHFALGGRGPMTVGPLARVARRWGSQTTLQNAAPSPHARWQGLGNMLNMGPPAPSRYAPPVSRHEQRQTWTGLWRGPQACRALASGPRHPQRERGLGGVQKRGRGGVKFFSLFFFWVAYVNSPANSKRFDYTEVGRQTPLTTHHT